MNTKMAQGFETKIFDLGGCDAYPFAHLAKVQGQRKNLESIGGVEWMAVKMYELQMIRLEHPQLFSLSPALNGHI